MKVAFFQPFLNVRGSTVALYDYAYYNEKLLNNESLVIYDKNDPRNDDTAIKRFEKNLNCISLNSINDLNNTLVKNQYDAVYITKRGYRNDPPIDGLVSGVCKTLIQALGLVPESEAHGDVFAYCSYFSSNHCSNGRLPVVPYMIDLPDINDNLRNELNIPDEAIVFGRNGGFDTFCNGGLNFPLEVIKTVLDQKEDIYFVFQNTPELYTHPRILHIHSTSDMEYKTKFINTCDAMIHFRHEGETYGMSCGEFSTRNKPVITWYGSPERNHIEILGDKGIYFMSPQDLYNIFMNFKPSPSKDWNCYREYSPEKVMKIFKEVYLD